jgi:TonB-linked SusC/RagA family outer membrane protein
MEKVYKCLRLTSLVWVFLLSTVAAYAQDRNVSGTVSDETGSPMPGVNVLIKGTTTGTATDGDGKYTLSVPANATLVFTFVGYTTSEVPVGSQTVVDVAMNPDATTLSEIVVTGYSSQRKQDITGAVSVVKLDELQNIQASNIGQKLEGRAAGVTMTTSGEPGEGANIRIRGLTSFALDNDPLWIVDGMQMQGDKAASWLNPNDIETIQVLKDASAASIYGSRASNGVVIVTTKKGKAGKTKVEYNGYTGVQSAVGGYNSIISTNPIENAKAFHEYFANGSAYTQIPSDNYYHQYDLDGTLPDMTWPVGNLASNGDVIRFNGTQAQNGDGSLANINSYKFSRTFQSSDDDFLYMGSNQKGTDWWDELFRTAPITEHNINVSGGSDNSTFNIGAGYFKQDGTMINTNFERYSVRANSTFKIGKVTIGENLTFARTFRTSQVGSNQDNQNSLTNTLLMHPIIPVYDIGGNFAGAKAISNGSNPVAAQYFNRKNGNTGYKVFGSVFGEAQLTSWLKFRTTVGVDFNEGVFRGFSYATPQNREPSFNNGYQENWSNGWTWQNNNILEANKKFGNHSITVMVGHEALKSSWRSINGRINNYVTQDINAWYLNPGFGDVSTRSVTSFGGQRTLLSYFGKVDYNLSDKYLVSATLRRDGSSAFGPNQRWATFPAFSVGWRVSSESFMSGISLINDLKIRGGYGVTGNQGIDPGNAFSRFGGSPGTTFYDINGVNTGSIAAGYALVFRGNPDGRWEENSSVNGGFDLTMLGGKLQVVLDVYKRTTDGLLYGIQLPGTAGSAQNASTNIGSLYNKGFDFNVSYRGKISGDLNYNASLNVSHYKNQITYVSDDVDFFYSSGADGHDQYVRNEVGYPMSSFYGLNYLGPIRSASEASSLPTGVTGSNWAGGWSFEDVDGDDGIDADDRKMIGNPHPKAVVGLNLGLNYKGFDFSTFLFSSIGNDIYNYQRYYYEAGRWGSVFSKDMMSDSWTPERTNARLPQLNIDNVNAADRASSYYIEKGSYLRVKTIQFGYNVPADIMTRIAGSSGRARVYLQAQNPFTFSKYSGIDPALSNVNIGDGDANDGYLGTDLGNYPTSRIFSIGLTLGF